MNNKSTDFSATDAIQGDFLLRNLKHMQRNNTLLKGEINKEEKFRQGYYRSRSIQKAMMKKGNLNSRRRLIINLIDVIANDIVLEYNAGLLNTAAALENKALLPIKCIVDMVEEPLGSVPAQHLQESLSDVNENVKYAKWWQTEGGH